MDKDNSLMCLADLRTKLKENRLEGHCYNNSLKITEERLNEIYNYVIDREIRRLIK